MSFEGVDKLLHNRGNNWGRKERGPRVNEDENENEHTSNCRFPYCPIFNLCRVLHLISIHQCIHKQNALHKCRHHSNCASLLRVEVWTL